MKGDSSPCNPESSTELDTIRQALAGDDAAFQKIVYLYSRRLYAVAYGVVQDATEAEDAVQETFLKAYTQRRLIRDPTRFPAWLFRTARNRALNMLRRRRRHPIANESDAMDELPDATAPCPSAGLRESERDGAVRRLLDSLPENHRIAVTLRFMEGMDYRQIEETMGISPGTVRGLLSRAMKTLRKATGATFFTDLTGVH